MNRRQRQSLKPQRLDKINSGRVLCKRVQRPVAVARIRVDGAALVASKMNHVTPARRRRLFDHPNEFDLPRERLRLVFRIVVDLRGRFLPLVRRTNHEQTLVWANHAGKGIENSPRIARKYPHDDRVPSANPTFVRRVPDHARRNFSKASKVPDHRRSPRHHDNDTPDG